MSEKCFRCGGSKSDGECQMCVKLERERSDTMDRISSKLQILGLSDLEYSMSVNCIASAQQDIIRVRADLFERMLDHLALPSRNEIRLNLKSDGSDLLVEILRHEDLSMTELSSAWMAMANEISHGDPLLLAALMDSLATSGIVKVPKH